MRKEVNYINPASFDISIEEFDALSGTHEFSEEYKKRKKKMIREYRRSAYIGTKHFYAKVAAAVLLLAVVSTPIIAYAATGGEFFSRIWGSLTKGDVKSHKEVLYNEQDIPFFYTFPEREYADTDQEKAEELIGSNISHEKVVKKLGDTTLTILSSVYDGYAGVVEFKLEREGGVNAFEYSQTDNEYRGAEFSQEPSFWFHFPECSENILVDLERSTKEVLYCYDYITTVPEAYDTKEKGIALEVCEYPCTRGEMFEADADTFEKYRQETKTSNITVPFQSPVKRTEYTNKDNGIAGISSIGMVIDMDRGLGLEQKNEKEGYDPENIYYVSVNYKNGEKYIVREHALQDIHACDKKIENSNAYSCNEKGNLVLVFNRLVDTAEVESITVNDVTYAVKG